MTSVAWYYARGTKQSGPVTPAELRRLALTGELHPDDLVWREGMAEWTTASHVRGLFDTASDSAIAMGSGIASAPGAAPPPTELVAGEAPAPPSSITRNRPRFQWPLQHPLDPLLDYFRTSVSQHFIETTTRMFRYIGLYGLLFAIVPAMVFGLILTVKTQEPKILLLTIAAPPIFIVLQYVSGRFCSLVEQLNRNTSASVASTTVLDCFVLFSPVLGIGVLWAGVVSTAVTGVILGPTLGIVGFFVCLYGGCIALCPASINVTIVPETRVCDEAMGLLSFLLKAALQCAPIWYGAGVASGLLMMVYACFQAVAGQTPELGLAGVAVTATAAATAFLASAAIPVIAYFGFLLGHLPLDLMLAVLSLSMVRDQLTGSVSEPQREATR